MYFVSKDPETGVKVAGVIVRVLGLRAEPLERQPVLLTPEPLLQPSVLSFAVV